MSRSSFPPADMVQQADADVANAIENMIPSTRSVFDGVLREVAKAETRFDAVDALEAAYHLIADTSQVPAHRRKLRVIPGGL